MRCILNPKHILVPFILWLIIAGCEDRELTTTPIPSLIPSPSFNTSISTSAAQSTEEIASLSVSIPLEESISPRFLTSPTSISTLEPEPGTPRTTYTISATLDYAAHSIFVQEQVAYSNQTPTSITSLPLVIEPARYPGAFHLTSLFWEDGSRITQYQLRESRLTLNLSQLLPPGEIIRFSISYFLQLPSTSKMVNLRPYPFGYTKLQANLGDWYPFIPPYDEQKGWLIHDPGFFGEHLVYDIADFDVDIRLIGEQTNLVLSASAPPRIEGDRFYYHHMAARSFAWSASPYYQVITQTVELPGNTPITVASYFFPFYEQAGERIAGTIVQALPLYSRLFGIDYIHPWLSAVQADFLDGMEYDGLFFLSKDFYNWYNGSSQDFLVALSAHETAHQWFYGLVGNDQALEPWLDEALCTYSERLFYENLYPESLDWWWSYRVNYYEPKGWVDTNIYESAQEAGQYRRYRDAVYLNGAIFLEELRTLVGDQAFFDSLQTYLSQNRYGQGTAPDFFEALSRSTDIDLGPLLKRYFSH